MHEFHGVNAMLIPELIRLPIHYLGMSTADTHVKFTALLASVQACTRVLDTYLQVSLMVSLLRDVAA